MDTNRAFIWTWMVHLDNCPTRRSLSVDLDVHSAPKIQSRLFCFSIWGVLLVSFMKEFFNFVNILIQQNQTHNHTHTQIHILTQTYRCPALVNPYVNLQLHLHVKKKVQLKVHVKVQMKVPFMWRFMWRFIWRFRWKYLSCEGSCEGSYEPKATSGGSSGPSAEYFSSH